MRLRVGGRGARARGRAAPRSRATGSSSPRAVASSRARPHDARGAARGAAREARVARGRSPRRRTAAAPRVAVGPWYFGARWAAGAPLAAPIAGEGEPFEYVARALAPPLRRRSAAAAGLGPRAGRSRRRVCVARPLARGPRLGRLGAAPAAGAAGCAVEEGRGEVASRGAARSTPPRVCEHYRAGAARVVARAGGVARAVVALAPTLRACARAGDARARLVDAPRVALIVGRARVGAARRGPVRVALASRGARRRRDADGRGRRHGG